MISGQLWTKDKNGYGGKLKVKGQHDSFQFILENGYSLIQIKEIS